LIERGIRCASGGWDLERIHRQYLTAAVGYLDRHATDPGPAAQAACRQSLIAIKPAADAWRSETQRKVCPRQGVTLRG